MASFYPDYPGFGPWIKVDVPGRTPHSEIAITFTRPRDVERDEVKVKFEIHYEGGIHKSKDFTFENGHTEIRTISKEIYYVLVSAQASSRRSMTVGVLAKKY